ncbi:LysM peptidoglycan-binding domain-containing protein [Negadavirga shengliensis]|uniref:LysM peptidoglycan-binding domain-containing protein n=1 Tax=Negadavirga shengliensis TaxID=1389218 RepID=A0ABV9T5P7_9BACT
MNRSWLLISGFCLVSAAVCGSDLYRADSVGVEKVGDKSYIIHQVDPQETLFGISRRYNTPVSDIVQSNESLKEGLKIGQRIRVPFIEKEAIPAGAMLHQVSPGETLFAIAKKYNVSVQDVMDWNKLQGTDLSVGQSVLIHGIAEEPVSGDKIEETVAVADQKVAVTKQPVKSQPDKKTDNKPPTTHKANEATKEKAPSASPLDKPAAVPSEATTVKTATSSTGNWLSHTVGQGETLFSIAKKYDAKVEDLIKWNGLSSNNLSVGQTLKVGRETGANIPVTRFPSSENNNTNTATANTGTSSSSNSTASSSTISSPGSGSTSASPNVSKSTEFKNIKETGQAEVIEGTGNHKKYLVLHRTAPVGTIMRVRNEQNDITIFARVVGVLPETGDNNKLLIKVSKAAYDQLKAVNSRFPVEVSY